VAGSPHSGCDASDFGHTRRNRSGVMCPVVTLLCFFLEDDPPCVEVQTSRGRGTTLVPLVRIPVSFTDGPSYLLRHSVILNDFILTNFRSCFG